jgi:hypothetical protein
MDVGAQESGSNTPFMSTDKHEVRIVAIAIRSQRLGFAVLEDSLGLMDWRTLHYKGNHVARVQAAKHKLISLFALYLPSVIVVESSQLRNALNSGNVDSIGRFLRRESRLRAIPVLIMTRKSVRDSFKEAQGKSKDAIAVLLTQMFPELISKLPPRRSIWHGEHPIMPLFDAVALAVAYWVRQQTRDPTAG